MELFLIVETYFNFLMNTRPIAVHYSLFTVRFIVKGAGEMIVVLGNNSEMIRHLLLYLSTFQKPPLWNLWNALKGHRSLSFWHFFQICYNTWRKLSRTLVYVRSEATPSLIYVATPLLRRRTEGDQCEWWAKTAANLKVLKNYFSQKVIVSFIATFSFNSWHKGVGT